MKCCIWNILIGLVCLLPATVLFADEPKAPGTVKALWADFDPRQDALDAKIVREWEKDGIVYRYVTYRIGTFKGKPDRDIGSGLMIYEYGLDDGSKVLLGFPGPDKILYAKHVKKDGKAVDLPLK